MDIWLPPLAACRVASNETAVWSALKRSTIMAGRIEPNINPRTLLKTGVNLGLRSKSELAEGSSPVFVPAGNPEFSQREADIAKSCRHTKLDRLPVWQLGHAVYVGTCTNSQTKCRDEEEVRDGQFGHFLQASKARVISRKGFTRVLFSGVSHQVKSRRRPSPEGPAPHPTRPSDRRSRSPASTPPGRWR